MNENTDKIPSLPGRWVIIGLMILSLFPKLFFGNLDPPPSPFADVIVGPYFLDSCLGPITAIIVLTIAGGLLLYKSLSWILGIIYYILFVFYSILAYMSYPPAFQTPSSDMMVFLSSLWKHGTLLNLLVAVIIIVYLARPVVRKTLQFHDPSWREQVENFN